MIFNFFSKTREIHCKDGTIRVIYKDINDVYPLSINGLETDFSAGISGADQIKGQAKLKLKTDIKGLVFQLNEQNQSLMISFRNLYLFYSSNPCENGNFYERETIKLLEEQRIIQELKLKITGLIQLASNKTINIEDITHIFSDIASRMGGKSLAPSAKFEIAQNRNLAKAILGDQ